MWVLTKKIKLRINIKDKKLIFLYSISILPILLILITSFVTGSKIRTMWMTPFYLFFGVLFVYILRSQIDLKKIKFFYMVFYFYFFYHPLFILLFQFPKLTRELITQEKILQTKFNFYGIKILIKKLNLSQETSGKPVNSHII